jgi:hypothetical protein
MFWPLACSRDRGFCAREPAYGSLRIVLGAVELELTGCAGDGLRGVEGVLNRNRILLSSPEGNTVS